MGGGGGGEREEGEEGKEMVKEEFHGCWFLMFWDFGLKVREGKGSEEIAREALCIEARKNKEMELVIEFNRS